MEIWSKKKRYGNKIKIVVKVTWEKNAPKNRYS